MTETLEFTEENKRLALMDIVDGLWVTGQRKGQGHQQFDATCFTNTDVTKDSRIMVSVTQMDKTFSNPIMGDATIEVLQVVPGEQRFDIRMRIDAPEPINYRVSFILRNV